MAIASILIGIMTGIVSFVAALIAGHDLALAFGFYVLGGMVGVFVTVALVLLRPRTQRQEQAGAGMVAVRG